MDSHLASKKHKLMQAEYEKNLEIMKNEGEAEAGHDDDEIEEEWEDEAGEILFKLKEDAQNAKIYQKRLREASTEVFFRIPLVLIVG